MCSRMRSAILIATLLAAVDAGAADPSPDDLDFFEKRVRPVLVQHCFKCHGDKKQEAGLRLDSREGALKGGDSGAVIQAGKPEESLLVEAIGYGGDVRMPPKGK